jgi:hypothetical protein
MRSLQALRSKAALVVKRGFTLDHPVYWYRELNGYDEHTTSSSCHNGSITGNWGSARSGVQEAQLPYRRYFPIYQTMS